MEAVLEQAPGGVDEAEETCGLAKVGRDTSATPGLLALGVLLVTAIWPNSPYSEGNVKLVKSKQFCSGLSH